MIPESWYFCHLAICSLPRKTYSAVRCFIFRLKIRISASTHSATAVQQVHRCYNSTRKIVVFAADILTSFAHSGGIIARTAARWWSQFIYIIISFGVKIDVF